MMINSSILLGDKQAILRWATEMTLKASHWSSIGFSVYHELFRLIVEKITANPKRLWATQGPGLVNCPSSSHGKVR